jgi:uncharacterized membrane protein
MDKGEAMARAITYGLVGCVVGWVLAKVHTALGDWRSLLARFRNARREFWRRAWYAFLAVSLVALGLYVWGAGFMDP